MSFHQANSGNQYIADVYSSQAASIDNVTKKNPFLSTKLLPKKQFLPASVSTSTQFLPTTASSYHQGVGVLTKSQGENHAKKSFENDLINPFLLQSCNLKLDSPSEPVKTASSCASLGQKDDSSQMPCIIEVRNIPKKFLAEEFLHSHFSKFGIIVRVDIKVQTNTACITFLNREGAKSAMQSGNLLEDGNSVEVNFVGSKLNKLLERDAVMKFCTENKTKRRNSFDKFKTLLANLVQDLQLVVCYDSKSKFDVLDQIDKALRKGLKRDREEYKALYGICMDMCPEKERYMREDRNQISYYEQKNQEDNVAFNSNKIDHNRAIKEYSRSSADQEEPLPHELRPAFILKQTMNFLIQNFIKEEFTQRQDWFDFIWNRSRAIRKDITQQNLHCLNSIEVIEKCARFHIMCSHHLCEHDMHVFDAKINLENLTKCLQTLKHMYEDTSKEKSMPCKNEAEFRCYQILLNLNNGDILREVMAFSQNVRDSYPVQFALQVFSSVQENNYIKFFKLLRQTSYLNACLMHPYFIQIRSIALKLVARAFSVPKQDIGYPLEKIKDILLFDDVKNAVDFCSHYAFATDNANVYLNRISFMTPDDSFPRKKSVVISNKCMTSLAEVVMGSALLPLPSYTPTNSFSLTGHYIGVYHKLDYASDMIDVLDMEDETILTKVKEVEAEAPVGFATAASQSIPSVIVIEDSSDKIPQKDESAFISHNVDALDLREKLKRKRTQNNDPEFVVTNEDIEDANVNEDENHATQQEPHIMILREDILIFSKDIIDEEIFFVVQDVISEVFTDIKHEQLQSEGACQQLLAMTCIQEARATVMEVIEEEWSKNKKKQAKLFEEEIITACTELIAGHVETMLKGYCQEVYRYQIEHIDNSVEQVTTNAFVENTITLVVNREVRSAAANALEATMAERKENLLMLKQQFTNAKIRKLFHQWMRAFKYHTLILSTLQEFPPLAPFNSTTDVLRLLDPNMWKHRNNRLSFAEVTKMESEQSYKGALRSYQLHNEKIRDILLKPILLESLFEDFLRNASLDRRFAKKDAYWRLVINSSASYDGPDTTLSPGLIMKKLRNIPEKTSRNKIFNAVIKKNGESSGYLSITNIPPRVKHGIEWLYGNSGLMFIVNVPHNPSMEFWTRNAAAITLLLRSRETDADIPLAVIVLTMHYVTTSQAIDNLKLRHVLEGGDTMLKCVVFNKNVVDAIDFNKRLQSVFAWLLQKSCPYLPMTSKTILAFVEEVMGSMFFKLFHEYCLHCRSMVLPSPKPNDILALYNNVLQEIAFFVERSEPRNPELDEEDDIFWSDSSVLQKARDLILRLTLPSLPNCDECDWDASYETCLQYVHHVFSNTTSVLTNRIDSLLRQKNQRLFPWSDVLELCIIKKLSSMYPTAAEENSFSNIVHYYEDDVKQLRVNNPLKLHIKDFSMSRLSAENSNILKKRKYSREHLLRDSIENINAELEELNESFKRKRKSPSRLSNSYAATAQVQDLLNETVSLCRNAKKEKEFNKCRNSARLSFFRDACYTTSEREETSRSRSDSSSIQFRILAENR
ncbi:germinal-center associated nuclear protein-like isoform X2 [Hydractinia symbiolongicarpus]|uniref:germinal-center associated nuclear protein-like isoform X2 n=1 Tax=Hydractinia symbiolongicarpus TaxID=13093 RepID=UPI00254B677C|nr:germinal-center associated nuclear protein-like isoform X2 [Hydractinia symbiolongicarpus]